MTRKGWDRTNGILRQNNDQLWWSIGLERQTSPTVQNIIFLVDMTTRWGELLWKDDIAQEIHKGARHESPTTPTHTLSNKMPGGFQNDLWNAVIQFAGSRYEDAHHIGVVQSLAISFLINLTTLRTKPSSSGVPTSKSKSTSIPVHLPNTYKSTTCWGTLGGPF